MVGFALNLGVIAVYMYFVFKLLKGIGSINSVLLPGLRRRHFAVMFAASVALLFKFWSLNDAVLITGQAVVVLMLCVYALLLFVPAALPTSKRPRPGNKELQSPAGKPKRYRKKLLIRLPAAGIVLMLSLWLVKTISAPSEGTIQYVPLIASDQPAPAVKQITLSAKTFTFNYPDSLESIATDPPKPPFIESHNLLKRQTAAWILAVQIESLPSGNLQDDGSYNFRLKNPDRFTAASTNVNGMDVKLMTDKTAGGGLAQAAFFMHNGKLASVSLIGGASTDKAAMQELFNGILSSWHWK